MTKNTRVWVKGLIATIVNGFASGIVLVIADPVDFNLGDGLPKLMATSAVFALLGLANYLKERPLPDDDDVVTLRSLVLPLLLAGALASGCAGAIRPPVITGEDQASVRAAASKAFAGIEVAGVVVRDGRQLVSDLHAAGVVSLEVRSAVNQAVIAANDIVQRVIVELGAATRMVTVTGLVAQAAEGMNAVASVLERQADPRIQTAGRFLRTAIGAVVALVGGAR